MVKVTFNRYVKHNDTRYAAGASVDVSDDDYKALVAAGVVDGESQASDERGDLFSFSAQEIDKGYKIADIKSFLDAEGFDYPADAKKAELIKLIVGE